MKLDSITLHNFRSYKEQEFDFSEKVTVITGGNGTGKTNLLEAIYMLYMGRSFRDGDDDLIRYGEEWFRVCGTLQNHQREIRYQPSQQVRKNIILDNQPPKRFTYKQQLPVVLFEPDDVLMVHGSPSLRRGYIDDVLVKTNPTYGATLARYERALLQRNNVLKQQGMSLSALRDAVFVWDVALSEYGAIVQAERVRLTGTLNETISETYSKIAGKEQTVLLRYESKVCGDNQLLAKGLVRALEHDRLRGTTSVGPHRDDVVFYLNAQPVKQIASRGEVRTLVLALKELELEHINQALGVAPLFLLDDVFSELDTTRQHALIADANAGQKVITTTTATGLGVGKHATVIKLS